MAARVNLRLEIPIDHTSRLTFVKPDGDPKIRVVLQSGGAIETRHVAKITHADARQIVKFLVAIITGPGELPGVPPMDVSDTVES